MRFQHVLTGLMLGGGGGRKRQTHPRTKVKVQVNKGRGWKSERAITHKTGNIQRNQNGDAMGPERVVARARCRVGGSASRVTTRSRAARASRLSSGDAQQLQLAAAATSAAAPMDWCCNLVLLLHCTKLRLLLLHAELQVARKRARTGGCDLSLLPQVA